MISVILPTYNAGKHLERAVASIAMQTIDSWELLVIDDGSTDGSTDFLDRPSLDGRLKLLRRAHTGLVPSLNHGIRAATGVFAARMDADDWSHPDRLRQQLSYLTSHPQVGVLGTCYEVVADDSTLLESRHVPSRDRAVRRALAVRNVFGHGTVMMRRSAFLEVGGYRDEAWPAEDYDLWLRMAHRYNVGNLPRVLYRYTSAPGGISAQNRQLQDDRTRQLSMSMGAPVPGTFATDAVELAMEWSVTRRCHNPTRRYVRDLLAARRHSRARAVWLASDQSPR